MKSVIVTVFALLIGTASAADYSFFPLTRTTVTGGTRLDDAQISAIHSYLRAYMDKTYGEEFGTTESVEVYYNCVETPNGLFCAVGFGSEGGSTGEFIAIFSDGRVIGEMEMKVISQRDLSRYQHE